MRAHLILIMLLVAIFMLSCADRTGIYDMPSAGLSKTPEWSGIVHPTRDTIYVVIQLPESYRGDYQAAGQAAQSQLNARLETSVEPIITDFFDRKMPELTEEQRFQNLNTLPRVTEKIMRYSMVQDGYENPEGVVILCAIDAESAALAVIEEMDLPERAFLLHFKRQLESWVKVLEE
jgi:hypothetical protein